MTKIYPYMFSIRCTKEEKKAIIREAKRVNKSASRLLVESVVY